MPTVGKIHGIQALERGLCPVTYGQCLALCACSVRCSICVSPPHKAGEGNIWLMLEQRENPKTKEMNQNQKVGRMNPCPEKSKQWLAYFTGRRDCKPHMHVDLQCEARRRDNLRRPSNHLPGRAVSDIQRNTNQKQSASASAFFRRTHVPSLEPLHPIIGVS